MIFIYLAFLIVGGILLGGSLLLGAMHADADHDAHLEADGNVDAEAGDGADAHVDADSDAEAHAEAEHGGDHEASADAAGIWLPFMSLRFWVFTACFFGLCGTLLTVIGVGTVVTAVVSIAVGLLCGTAAAFVVHRLSRLEATGDVPTSKEFVGAVGTVLVEVDNDSRGKVRVSIREQQVDLVAETSDEAPLKAGQKVLVVDYKDGVAVVTKSSED
jgi:hypothetical protein